MAFSFPKLPFSLFQSSTTNVIGVDIGSSAIKIVQVRKDKEQAVLETYGELSTGAYESKESGRVVSLEEERVAQMILDLRKEANISGTQGFIGIPLRYSFIKSINLPAMPAKEVASAIPFEARKYVPLPIKDVNLDWQLLGMSEAERKAMSGKTPVLIAATQKDAVERFDRVVKKAGIKPLGFEIEAFSGIRAVIGRIRNPTLVLDLGAASTKVAVSEHGSIRAAYGIDRGSQNLTLTLASATGIDFARAEQIKRSQGIIDRPETTEMRKAMLPVLDGLLAEADRLRLFYTKQTSHSIERIILIGGGASLPGLVEYSAKHFGLEVALGNPFATLEYPTVIEPIIKDIGPTFSNAVGLVLRAVQQI